MRPTTRRLRGAAAALALVATTLTACGSAGPIGESLAGVHDAPAERTGSAITPERGAQTMTETLDRAAAASQANTKAGSTSRQGAFTGPALYESDRVANFKAEGGKVEPMVASSKGAELLAISQGTKWPRAMLATQRVGNRQKLMMLVSREPGDPFKIFAVTDMEPGASLPALGPLEDGAKLVAGPQGLVASPRLVAHRWSQAVAFPNPAKAEMVSLDDAYTTALRSNASKQQKSMGSLANLTQGHKGLVGGSMAFRLKDGGAVSMSGLRRRDVVQMTDKGRKLILPPDLRTLVNKPAVKERIEVSTLETVAFIIPAEGKASLIGAREQISSAWAR
ncbi:hypothetical protein [Kribbia dieselivorans]|uniref:hypothetical protein n=1 Tax=Kribbia dieselivorans TaxID=331526 RepID=UPI000838E120|nr:hypothetical protein [Kribbia dieselivorans]